MDIRSRRLAPLAALALLVACGGKGSAPAAPPGPLQLTCSVSLSGPSPVLNVLARATTTAAAGAPAITVTLKVKPTTQTLALAGPGWATSKEFRGVDINTGEAVSAEAVIDGTLATAACVGSTGLPTVTARLTRTATGADLDWDAVPGAAVYRWTIRDGLDGAVLASGSTATTSAQAVVPAGLPGTSVAEVGAYALTGTETSFPAPLPTPRASFGRAILTGGAAGGDGVSAWQLFGPGDFVGGTLTVVFPSLGTGERLAVLLANAGGDDSGFATVSVVGTGAARMAPAGAPLAALAAAPLAPLAGADEGFDRSDVMAGEALVAERRTEVMAQVRQARLQRGAEAGSKGPQAARAVAAAIPAARSFCQGRISATGTWSYVWTGAALAHQTANAAFYYSTDTAVAAGIDQAVATRPDFWTALGDAYENRILGTLNTYFGPETDVDGNGKMVFLLGNLGKTTSGGFVVGYFCSGRPRVPARQRRQLPQRLLRQPDRHALPDRSGYLHDQLGRRRGSYAQVLDLILAGEYPGIMAHELQHDVNFNTQLPHRRALRRRARSSGSTRGSPCSPRRWPATGSTPRATAPRSGATRGSPPVGLPYYQGFSMTAWDGDAVRQLRRGAGLHAVPARPRLAGHDQGAREQVAGRKGQRRGGHRRALGGRLRPLRHRGHVLQRGHLEASGALGALTSTGHHAGRPALQLPRRPRRPPTTSPGTTTRGTAARHREGRATAYVAYTPVTTSASATLRPTAGPPSPPAPGRAARSTLRYQGTGVVRPHVVVVKYGGALLQLRRPDLPVGADPKAGRRDRPGRSRRRRSGTCRARRARPAASPATGRPSADGARCARRWRAS